MAMALGYSSRGICRGQKDMGWPFAKQDIYYPITGLVESFKVYMYWGLFSC